MTIAALVILERSLQESFMKIVEFTIYNNAGRWMDRVKRNSSWGYVHWLYQDIDGSSYAYFCSYSDTAYGLQITKSEYGFNMD